MKLVTQHHIQLSGRRVDYRVVFSNTARKLRLRVGANGVELVQPTERNGQDVSAFIHQNEAWLLDQLQRVERLRGVQRPMRRQAGQILFRGEPARLRIETTGARTRSNAVSFANGEIVVQRGVVSGTSVARSLENWLDKQARAESERQRCLVAVRLRQKPLRVYVMGQRTKWGNCTAERKSSLNWPYILDAELGLPSLGTN